MGLISLLCPVLFYAGVARPESKGFILLSSTIGPIDAGIVGALENAFEKETGIRGAGTRGSP